MTRPITAKEIRSLDQDEAMRLAAAEYDRLLALADDLRAEDWSRPTDCTGPELELELDTVQFARILSGRDSASGLLATAVPF